MASVVLQGFRDSWSTVVMGEMAGNSYLRLLLSRVVVHEVQLIWTQMCFNECKKHVPDAFLQTVISSDLNSLYKAIFRIFLIRSAKFSEVPCARDLDRCSEDASGCYRRGRDGTEST